MRLRSPCSIFSLWTDSQCLPARCCQLATVLSSNPNACTIAWVGRPYASKRITVTKSSSGFRIPSNAVPFLVLNVLLHVLHLPRGRFDPCDTIFPCPISSLDGHSKFGQNRFEASTFCGTSVAIFFIDTT